MDRRLIVPSKDADLEELRLTVPCEHPSIGSIQVCPEHLVHLSDEDTDTPY